MSIAPSAWQPLEERLWDVNQVLVAAYRTVGGPIRVSIECSKLEDQLPSMSVAEARKLVTTLERAIKWADERRGT